MGFVTLGIFIFREQGLQGARASRWSPTASSPAPCSCSSASSTSARMTGPSPRWAASAAHSRSTRRSSVFFVLASLGLPGLAGFVGEFLVLVGAFDYWPSSAAIAALAMMLRRGVPAVDVPARRLRRPVATSCKGLGHHLTDMTPVEVADAGAARRAGDRLRPLPGAAARPLAATGDDIACSRPSTSWRWPRDVLP